ncbi:DNA-protecting protein DprA [Marinicauda salina]|uniref:DNA-protecting protein DprA n=2 Tax=Marinicauda salina TaxID=2135793 RepID=A0A2U2BRL8_9PROT|nr:DNA-protecting protein DprA [Marinicauda salina]
MDRFDTPEAAIEALPRLARRGGRVDPIRIVSRAAAEDEIAAVEAVGARLLCACEPDFPALLAAIDPPPPVISARGALDANAQPACALVGARNASAVGLRFAGDLARGLGARGVTVVSGLARGVDGAAHAGALETGTIAVLAGGIDQIYPPEHAELHAAIGETGLLVSESPPGHVATARDFPRRNRLISGLSLGVVVVEAAERSGSLITARLAAEQNREVMAVPGSPLDPRSKGTNRLLRDGAALIESVDDVLAILEQGPRPQAAEPPGDAYDAEPPEPNIDAEADDVRERIVALLSPSPVSRDELARAAGASPRAVMAALVELELAGRCEIQPGGMVRLAYPSGD